MKMELSEKMSKDMFDFSQDFFIKTLKDCEEEGLNGPQIIGVLHKKAMMCQTLLFCFMAEVRKESCVASIYSDMNGMSLEALDMLVKSPEVLVDFSSMNGSEPEQSVLDTVELFKSLNQAMNKGN